MRKPTRRKPQSAQQARTTGKSGKPASGELALIGTIRQRAGSAAANEVRLGIGDDCALLRLRANEDLAVTTDLSIDSQHFRLAWHPPESIGHRVLARGLSDLAAMGARPVAAFLSLGLPRSLAAQRGARWIDGFLDGLLALAAQHQTPLAGGDVAESPTALADIVLTGAVRRGRALLRSGARAGDRLFVTGSLGGAAAALATLMQLASARDLLAPPPGAPRPLKIPARLAAELAPHLYPQPRVAQGLALARRSLATACIDLSDGLSTDLAHLCEESGVAAVVNAAALPLAPGASLEQALHGGEDYELLFTASTTARIPRQIAGVAIAEIGRILRQRASQPTVQLKTAHGMQPLQRRGWEHFAWRRF
jgi:thiamine-monophosphate kinase